MNNCPYIDTDGTCLQVEKIETCEKPYHHGCALWWFGRKQPRRKSAAETGRGGKTGSDLDFVATPVDDPIQVDHAGPMMSAVFLQLVNQKLNGRGCMTNAGELEFHEALRWHVAQHQKPIEVTAEPTDEPGEILIKFRGTP